MRGIVKYIVGATYKPLLVRYLSKTRAYSFRRITLEIPPEVFHPGFFYSTRMLLRYISYAALQGKAVLELGAGSGLISIYAAKRGAQVTASDINPVAISSLEKNASLNRVRLKVVLSNLFENLSLQPFDYILINPPYYKKSPRTPKEHAWYCGENGEFFQGLFRGLYPYLHEGSEVLMVLCEGCDIEGIRRISEWNGYHMQKVLTRRNLIEVNYIFKISFRR